jgi:hypothetical protein
VGRNAHRLPAAGGPRLSDRQHRTPGREIGRSASIAGLSSRPPPTRGASAAARGRSACRARLNSPARSATLDGPEPLWNTSPTCREVGGDAQHHRTARCRGGQRSSGAVRSSSPVRSFRRGHSDRPRRRPGFTAQSRRRPSGQALPCAAPRWTQHRKRTLPRIQ